MPPIATTKPANQKKLLDLIESQLILETPYSTYIRPTSGPDKARYWMTLLHINVARDHIMSRYAIRKRVSKILRLQTW